jgi:hypothetical protein
MGDLPFPTSAIRRPEHSQLCHASLRTTSIYVDVIGPN